MTKLGTPTHIKDTYLRGRDYILQEILPQNTHVGLSLLKGFIIGHWEIIEWILEEESNANIPQ